MKNVHMCYIRVAEGKIENLKKEGKMRISTLMPAMITKILFENSERKVLHQFTC